MWGRIGASRRERTVVLKSLSKFCAIAEFDLSGKILSANHKYCRFLGYEPEDVVGRQHCMLLPADDWKEPAYAEFWSTLSRGESITGQFARRGKDGRETSLRATYFPVEINGNIVKIVEIADDITTEQVKAYESTAKFAAISRVQAVIEFSPDGQIISANENFLKSLGYTQDEIKGRHHNIFVEPEYARSTDYSAFWRRLNNGEYIAAEFMRLGKNRKEVWIQASYNPIFDQKGRVSKIIKFASDITERVHAVNQVSLALSRLAANDLTYRITCDLHTSFAQLKDDYNKSSEALQKSMKLIAENSAAIRIGASEIAAASDQLCHRTEQQAANLEETAAALDVIATTMTSSAEGTARASETVAAANTNARANLDVVREAVDAMNAITRSSVMVSQIIGVIDEIAFQTSLLALNAGVEAARAGEAGRGFAVVASEVRTLAQRSAEAAKEIKGLIHISTTEVERGVSLVNRTGTSLEHMVSQVNEIDDIVQAIAAGAKEQATGLSEINTAIGQMDRATQQNAAMSEEATAASQGLRGKADELSAMVDLFAVGDSTHSSQSTVRGPQSERQKATVSTPKLVANGGVRADWQEF